MLRFYIEFKVYKLVRDFIFRVVLLKNLGSLLFIGLFVYSCVGCGLFKDIWFREGVVEKFFVVVY